MTKSTLTPESTLTAAPQMEAGKEVLNFVRAIDPSSINQQNVSQLVGEMRTLIKDKQADLECIDTRGNTALHYVAQLGISPLADLLVSSGAEVNAKNHRFETPLHDAVAFYNVEVARSLIANKAEVTVANKRGETPLHMAFQSLESAPDQVLPLCSLLIEHNANPLQGTHEVDSTPIDYLLHNIKGIDGAHLQQLSDVLLKFHAPKQILEKVVTRFANFFFASLSNSADRGQALALIKNLATGLKDQGEKLSIEKALFTQMEKQVNKDDEKQNEIFESLKLLFNSEASSDSVSVLGGGNDIAGEEASAYDLTVHPIAGEEARAVNGGCDLM